MCASAPKPAVGAPKSIGSPAGAKKFTYAERRTAAQTLRSHARNNVATPSPEWLKKVEWARTVFPNYGQEKPQQEGAQAKRQRSIELPGPSAKRSKIQPSVSFAEITKDRVILGLIDRGNPENRIPRNKWMAVESKLSLICLRMVREKPGSAPCCMDAGWYQGSVKVVACDNQRSADLYKQAVAQLGAVYVGANIVALDWCDVPSRPRARIWLPAAIASPENILYMLQECNPHLLTKDWKVVKVEEHVGDVNQAIVVLNKESVALIEAARETLNYGFSAIHIKIYKGDSNSSGSPAGNPAEQVLAEEVEAPGVPEDGYSTDSSLSREMRAMGPAIDEVDLSDSEADVIVVEVAAGDVAKTPADQPTSQ
ncbi:uncharacterized protein LOC123037656 [Drosophila rhopaloa]|uniref:DUF4780 domain-containing protein n=1 Tax=Drosophila rhopaloa TaxID=1041015 RepID=A0ABM5J8T4_DRORH|nr:uncharacterized protein LOC123037656 [Drosophila rhopaloa]